MDHRPRYDPLLGTCAGGKRITRRQTTLGLLAGFVIAIAGCEQLAPDPIVFESRPDPIPVETDRPQVDVPLAPVGRIMVTPPPRPKARSDGPALGLLASGRASWFDVGGGLYAAAGPAIRYSGWRGDKVRVCAGDDCVVVVLSDWCYCYRNKPNERVIDLSADAFRRLAPLSTGLVKVRVERL